MTKEELIQRADNLKNAGEQLLKESQLAELLSGYGKVKITGSFRLNLLVNGDIDFCVFLNESGKKKAVEILNKLISQNYFRGYYFGDYTKDQADRFGRKIFPEGYYIGLNAMRDSEFWKFDIWFVKEDADIIEKENFMDYMEENLTPESRYEILRRKQERNEKKLDILSVDIYKEVLNHFKSKEISQNI